VAGTILTSSGLQCFVGPIADRKFDGGELLAVDGVQLQLDAAAVYFYLRFESGV
jgi:hypothetical protein